MAHVKSRFTLGILGAAILLGACTVKKQETPPLTGPSELGTSITITVSPDVLRQDGASQSIVTIVARDNNGQLLRNLSLRAEITVNDIVTDFGTLSARNLVTDANGRATAVYTAPPSPAVSIDTGTLVQIQVIPSGTDFGNATPRFASIRLVPTGVVTPPINGLTPKFTVNPTAPTDHQTVIFDASTSTAANATIVSYQWSFGDGDSGSGIATSHPFDESGTFVVTLVVTDSIGRVNAVSQSVAVSSVNLTAPNITTSPDSPFVGQEVFFTSTTQLGSNGRRISDYRWNFGDGTSGSGQNTSHVYQTPGTYTIVLTITDDQGHTASGTKSGFAVSDDKPQVPAPVITPNPPVRGQTAIFDASSSTAAPGRTIVSYQWTFSGGNPATASGTTASVVFPTSGAKTYQLTVTDNTGKSTTKTFTVSVVDPPTASGGRH